MKTNEIMQALADLYNSLGTMKVGIENNNIFILANGLHRIRDLMAHISQMQAAEEAAMVQAQQAASIEPEAQDD